jgi:glycosyltransferase involved in cell wall biosynthesis
LSTPLVSVVFSFRNEQENIPTLIQRAAAAFATAGTDYELLFVNDASTDGSLATLTAEHARNPRVKVLTMTRRFGVAECMRAGMAAAAGDAVIYMDADLQDPPEVIPQLIERWRAGADVVHTVRTRRRGENAVKMALTRLAYRAIHAGSTIELPIDAGDFKLLSRKAVDHLLSLRESDPYMRGLVVWLGMNQAFVPYERDARHAGRTHFPFFSRNPWKTFVMGLTSFSFMPIYATAMLAMAGLVLTALLALAALVLFFTGAAWTSLAVFYTILTFFWATTIGAVAAVGIYVVRIYKDVRQRPQYIIESLIPNPLSGIPNHESRIPNRESRITNHESRIANHESANHESAPHESRIAHPEPRISNRE